MQIKKLIKKGKAIAEAFSNELPVNEVWYQKRLEVCSSCPYNSDNVKDEDKTFIHKVRVIANPCPEKRHCTACGCCIDRKAAIKYEQCGAHEIGLEPKWKALEYEDNINKGVSMFIEDDSIEFQRVNNLYFVNFGESSENTVQMKFRLFVPNTYKYVNAVGCSCTVATPTQLDENNIEFDIKISTLNFRENVLNERSLNLNFNQGNLPRVVGIKFQLIKKAK